ncbi:MAG: dihydroorotase [Flavobacteriales bacterium]
MKTLIKSAIIVDPRSALHLKKRDLLIEDGVIIKIAAKIDEKKAEIIDAKGLHISSGWIDLRAQFRDPGEEFKEDIFSGLDAAKEGGFKAVVVMPTTTPAVDTKTQVEYLLRKSESHVTSLLPTGTLSAAGEGKQLSEMYDMANAGAIGFTDDKSNVGTELMTRALEYSSNFDGLIMTFPHDPGVNPGGMINEGSTSVKMGLKGISSFAEEIRLSRDIELLRYCGGRMHVSLISTAGSVDLIRKAKRDGLHITAAVAAHQLMFTDEDVASFDSNLKVMPPFRSENDRKALIRGLKDGTIDAIVSDHSPEDHEHKVLEFEYANYGISSIQTCFATANAALEKHLTIEQIIEKFTAGPARVLGLELPVIEEGEDAFLTLFCPNETETFSKEKWRSKSINSPFLDKPLHGKVIDVI